MIVRGIEGRKFELWQAGAPVGGVYSFNVRISLESGEVLCKVDDSGSSLVEFFAGLARDWAGFDDVRLYQSLEGQLRLAARHDGKGTVALTVDLRQPWPPMWSVSCELSVGAGAQLERVAADARAEFAQPN